MKSVRSDTVSFTVKGQLVIPQWLRKQFEIVDGTRAVVWSDGERILLRPLTSKFYKSIRGSLKGTKAMDVMLAERRRERER